MLRGNGPSPAIVPQAAVRRLPRWTLLLLCLAYVVPGYLGRDPWKSADIAAFGIMRELAATPFGASWLHPAIMGLPGEAGALLPYWIGAWVLQLVPAWLPPELVVRIPFALMLAGTLAATWWAVYYLARHPGAAPVAFAFGGEADPVDYARALADGALLALVATLGLAQFSHETAPALAQLFCIAVVFHALAAMPFRRLWPPLTLALGLPALSLCGAPALALTYAVVVVIGLFLPASGHLAPRYRSVARLAAGVAAVLCAALLVRALQVDWQASDIGLLPPERWRSLGQLLLWFTWPAWAFALWALWRWRFQLLRLNHNRHLGLPLLMGGLPLLLILLPSVGNRDRVLLLALPGMAALAAFALPTFKRSVSALIDWFSVLFFSGWVIAIWVVWISLQTGVPAKPASNVARLAPGFELPFQWVAFVVALLGTAGWIALARWRTARHRPALWKSLVLPAAGATVCWLLLMTLWLPGLNYGRSFAPQMRLIGEIVTPTTCVEVQGLSAAQVAALRFHGGWDTVPAGSTPQCHWLVVPARPDGRAARRVSPGWQHVQAVERPTAKQDTLALYRRAD